MKQSLTLTLTLLITLVTTPVAALAGSNAIPVSPGSRSDISLATGRCGGFSWAPARDALMQRLVVFEIDAAGQIDRMATGSLAEGTSALDVELPGSASSWTPPGSDCLETGRNYAWVVGSTDGKEPMTWSAPSFFRVSALPSTTEIAEALEVLRQAAAAGLLPDSSSSRTAATSGASPGSSPRAGESQPMALTLATATAAIHAELADVSGEAVGVIGISNSPDGAGLLAANASAVGGADLLLDGSSQSSTDTVVTESGIDRSSANPEDFNIENSGAGNMTLQVDGETVLAGDGSVGTDQLATGSVTLDKIAAAAVDSTRIVDLSVSEIDMAPNSVNFGAIQADAVRSLEIKDGEILDQDIAAAAGIDISKLDLTDKIDGIHLADTITLDASLELLTPNDVKIVLDDGVTDDVGTVLTLRHNTSGTAADGMGSSLRFVVEDPSNFSLDPAEIIATQETFTPRASRLTFKTYYPPSGAPQETFSIDAAGDVNVVNDLIVGGTISVGDMSIDTAELSDAAVTESKLATSVAGDGLTGGGGSPLAVGADDGSITVTTNGISVGTASDGQVADDLTIDGGAIDNTPIGATGPSTGAFITLATAGLTASGNVMVGSDAADQLAVVSTIQGATPLVFEGGTGDDFETSLAITTPTADRFIALPDRSGNVLLDSGNLVGSGSLTLDSGSTIISPAELSVLDGGLDASEVSGTNNQPVFAGIITPNGSSPAADNIVDGLTLVEGSAITIIGDGAADSVTFGVSEDSIDGTELADSITLDAATTISGDVLTLGSAEPVIIDDVLKLTPRSAAAVCTAGITGTIYYDSDDNTFCFCEAGTWRPLDGVGACA